MSILTYAQGDKFILRIYKQISDDPQERWGNIWELYATAAGNLGNLQAAANRALAFEQGMHGSHVQFKQYTISTWEPDSTPYNPENLFVQPCDILGSKTLTEPLSLEITLMLKRDVTSGRAGRVYLRGALEEGDIEREGRYMKLSDPNAMNAYMTGVLTASSWDHHFAGGVEALKIAMIGSALGGGVTWSRQVNGLTLGGAVTVDLTHRWYNQPNRSALAAARKAARAVSA